MSRLCPVYVPVADEPFSFATALRQFRVYRVYVPFMSRLCPVADEPFTPCVRQVVTAADGGP
jgi:hypothetical protein